jgi:CheY-like chemotaxis protein
MAKSGPIIIVDDDVDDKSLLEEVLKELGLSNNIIWFITADPAFEFLKTTSEQPFLIFSDVNLPGKNGIEFKREIDEDKQLRKKSIPFVFFSTSANQKSVNEAYTQMTVQGFFTKTNRYQEMKDTIKLIIQYWEKCKHPNA